MLPPVRHSCSKPPCRTLVRAASMLLVLGTILLLPSCVPRNPYSLAKPGPYHVGYRRMGTVDSSRNGRKVDITLWYPARKPSGSDSSQPAYLAEPDPRDAPYPLILSSTKVANVLAPLVVTHGFTWASVDRIDFWMEYNDEKVLQPQDLLFALDQAAAHPPEELAGMIDSDHAGTLGYSFDGYNSLAMSGARIDPAFYLAQCADPDRIDEALRGGVAYWGYCALADDWDAFAEAAGETAASGPDALWAPLTDPRIKAVMPMACDGWLLFGERGLAAADRPALILIASEDELYGEAAMIFEHLGSADSFLITFRDLDHMMMYDSQQAGRIAHFATAFFNCYLKGREKDRSLFSEAFVSRREELHWGVLE